MGDVVNVGAVMGLASKARAVAAADRRVHPVVHRKIHHVALLPAAAAEGAKLMTVYTPEEIEQTAQSTTIGRLGRDAEYLHLRGMVAELLVYCGGGTIVLMGLFKSGKKVLVKALQDFGKEANCVVIQATVDPEKMNASLVDTTKGKEAKAAMVASRRASREDHSAAAKKAAERVAETMAAADGKGRRPGRQRGSVYVEETDEAQLGFTAWREVLDNLLGEVDAFGLAAHFIERALAAEQTLIDEGTPSSSPVAAGLAPAPARAPRRGGGGRRPPVRRQSRLVLRDASRRGR